MQSFLVIGNWKMNGDMSSWQSLAHGLAATAIPDDVEMVLCPPAFGVVPVVQAVDGVDKIAVGVQDCFVEEKGAFTGDVSAEMAASCGCAYALAGHSERRAGHGESSALVAQKAAAAQRAGLVPVVCIGETLQTREAGKTHSFLAEQLEQSLDDVELGAGLGAIIAYEPVWAIGTGKAASAEEIADVFAFLRSWLVDKYDKIGYNTQMLYGGSVNADNAQEIANIEHVGGLLVGGASLDAKAFGAIVNAVA